MTLLRTCLAVALLAGCGDPAPAAKQGCDELSDWIAARLHSRGITRFELVTVDAKAENTAFGKVLGLCEGGTKMIVYP